MTKEEEREHKIFVGFIQKKAPFFLLVLLIGLSGVSAKTFSGSITPGFSEYAYVGGTILLNYITILFLIKLK